MLALAKHADARLRDEWDLVRLLRLAEKSYVPPGTSLLDELDIRWSVSFKNLERWVGNIEKRKKLVGWEVWDNYVRAMELEYRLLGGVIREKDSGAWELAQRQ